ncbi:MAG: NUDIX domain-containing protein [Gammaproteobacteria bacterium]|nr:NUDIX domain-containing protein [Gammaproteobacteria bacterium]
MKTWRPEPQILVKVIGLCRHRKRLLAMEVLTDSGALKGVRPLGGRVEFGESREDALKREFREELGAEIVTSGSWKFFENIYQHEGSLGHEYLFAMNITLLDTALYSREVIVFSEDSGSDSHARWFDIKALKTGEVELFPPPLLAHI